MVETPAGSPEQTYPDHFQSAESQPIQIISGQLRHSLSPICQFMSKSQKQLFSKLGWMELRLDNIA